MADNAVEGEITAAAAAASAPPPMETRPEASPTAEKSPSLSPQSRKTANGTINEGTSPSSGAGTTTTPDRPEEDRPTSSSVMDDEGSHNDDEDGGGGDDDADCKPDTATDATAESTTDEKKSGNSNSPTPVVSSNKKSRPPYKYDPSKITLRFLFANRDGLTVTIECEPSDTVGEVKGALLSVWPEDLPDCSGGDRLRLVCMGKGYLMPDTRTLEDCRIPVFKTHPTPINVSVAPETDAATEDLAKKNKQAEGGAGGAGGGGAGSRTPSTPSNTTQVSQGCACVIL